MNIVVRSDEVRVYSNEGERREKTVTFGFDPNEVEMVRAKDGAFIIREKKHLQAVNLEDNG